MTSLMTKNLILYPMSLGDLIACSKDFRNYGKPYAKSVCKIGFFERRRKKTIYRIKAEIIERQPESLLLSTMWLLVEGETGALVGEAGYKGPPIGGEVEIGYYTVPEHRGKGYMSEAVNALVLFAFEQRDYPVERVVATTKPKNFASHRVLEKNRFLREGTRGAFWLWVVTP